MERDPAKEADRYYLEQERRLKELPVCYDCEEPIQEDFCYVFFDQCFCSDCVSKHTKWL